MKRDKALGRRGDKGKDGTAKLHDALACPTTTGSAECGNASAAVRAAPGEKAPRGCSQTSPQCVATRGASSPAHHHAASWLAPRTDAHGSARRRLFLRNRIRALIPAPPPS